MLATHQRCRACIRAEFTLTAEPGHHNAGSNAQDNVKHDADDVIGDAGAGVFLVVFAKKAVHRITNDATEKHHEGIEHALHQCERDHVAVLNVRDFVCQHGFDFFAGHALQQTGGDSY